MDTQEDTGKNQEVQEVPSPKGLGEGFALEVGKQYVSRCGWVAGPMVATSKNSDYFDTHPFTDKETGRTFAPNGRYYLNTEDSKWDLLQEVPPEAAGLPKPSPAEGPSLPEVTQPGEGVDLEAMEKAMHTPGAESWRTLLGGIPALIAEVRSLRSSQEAAFRAGYSAGHASGTNEASDDVMRHNDSPDCDQAWEEYKEGLA